LEAQFDRAGVGAAADLNKAAASWIHRHTDSGQHIIHYHDAELYDHDAGEIANSLTPRFAPTFVNQASPCGFSYFFNGVDAQAQLIREIVDAVSVPLNALVQPAITTAFATSGGSIADGTYQARICWIDDTGPVTVYSEPSVVDAVVVSGGGGSATITFTEPGSAPGRATKFRCALTAAGASDTPANYLYFTDYAKGAGDQTWTALPSVSATQAFVDINGTYRTAVCPISNVDVACLHDGWLMVGSTLGHEVAWSERDNGNHWYPDQIISAAAETSWNGPVLGLVSAHKKCYVLCPDSIHAISGSFRRDDEGVYASYAIDVRSEPIDTGVGGVNHASIVRVAGPSTASVYFWSTYGPAMLTPSGASLIGVTDIEFFRNNILDPTYLNRIVGAEDTDLHSINWIVPRRVNASRPMDGASTAGICDRVIRYNMANKTFFCPLDIELVHISQRPNPTNDGDVDEKTELTGMGPHAGKRLLLNYGHSGGGADDVSGAAYNGLLASAHSTTSATVTLAGISADALIGQSVELYYPSTDDNFPSVRVRKTISDNTASDGSNLVTISWQGALTVPSGTKWTVRVAGFTHVHDFRPDLREYIQDLPPEHALEIKGEEYRLRDVVGAESIS